MSPPRWFWPILAACLLAVTVALVLHLRWSRFDDDALTDHYRSRVCLVGRGCVSITDSTVSQ